MQISARNASEKSAKPKPHMESPAASKLKKKTFRNQLFQMNTNQNHLTMRKLSITLKRWHPIENWLGPFQMNEKIQPITETQITQSSLIGWLDQWKTMTAQSKRSWIRGVKRTKRRTDTSPNMAEHRIVRRQTLVCFRGTNMRSIRPRRENSQQSARSIYRGKTFNQIYKLGGGFYLKVAVVVRNVRSMLENFTFQESGNSRI